MKQGARDTTLHYWEQLVSQRRLQYSGHCKKNSVQHQYVRCLQTGSSSQLTKWEIHEQVQVSWKVWWWWWGGDPRWCDFWLIQQRASRQREAEMSSARPVRTDSSADCSRTNFNQQRDTSWAVRPPPSLLHHWLCQLADGKKTQRKNWNEWHSYKAAKYIIDDFVLLRQLSYHMVAILPSGVKNSKVQPILQRHRKFRSSLLICAHHVLCYNNQNNL